MSLEWLKDLHGRMAKPADYAAKTLAAYTLGMKARGSIAGVRLQIDENCCEACRQLDGDSIYSPDDAPILPPDSCERGRGCLCVYRPVMTYELDDKAGG